MQLCSFLELDPPRASRSSGGGPQRTPHNLWQWAIGVLFLCGFSTLAFGHGVEDGDANFLQSQQGFHFWPYFYLGAKHMVTGYDHLLFLAGVIFFLYRFREVATYVTLFAIGHSLTLIIGVWFDIPANAFLIDAVIGFSIVYKAFENLGGFQRLGWQPNTMFAVWVFGLFHGFGLATKIQALNISPDGLLPNLLAFNLGVEAGQVLSLFVIVAFVNLWRIHKHFVAQAWYANTAIMTAGWLFVFYQLSGYFLLA